AIEGSNHICYLTPWDITMLSLNYIQKGLLFKKPSSIDNLLEKLKHSLSVALFHFYPLAGRLVTQKTQHPPSYSIFVDCKNSSGAKFIYATLDITISDILSPVDFPPLLQSLFDLNRAINHDGHTLPLLSIQVTQLLDGVFIGCSINHCIADGTSYWNFFNTWSHIFQDVPVLHPPLHNRWFPEGCGPLINLPFKHHDEFIDRYEPPKLRERIFHFSAESIAKLKAKANLQSNTNSSTKISSFQSLSAHVWRSITRVRGLTHDQKTSFVLYVNNRPRMEPPLPNEYFGASINVVTAEAKAGELVENDLGWTAWKVHLAVANFNDSVVHQLLKDWLQSPLVFQPSLHFDPCTVVMSSSPRFNMYGNEFGMGKAVAVRSGYANKFDGWLTAYEAYEGGGSIDLAVCLLPHAMTALESDHEFMEAVSHSNPLY
ncbi:Transferase, partial [Sesbania bispinosa]